MNYKASDECIRLIQHYEGVKLKAYKCPAGVWTIGYGHTGKDVKEGMTISAQRATDLLREDVADFAADVNSLLKVRVTQRQFDALVSFAFNVGSDIDLDDIPEGLGDSTLLKFVNKGDFAKAANEFPKWNKANGKVLPGLVKRRAAERALFTGVMIEGALRIGEAALSWL